MSSSIFYLTYSTPSLLGNPGFTTKFKAKQLTSLCQYQSSLWTKEAPNCQVGHYKLHHTNINNDIEQFQPKSCRISLRNRQERMGKDADDYQVTLSPVSVSVCFNIVLLALSMSTSEQNWRNYEVLLFFKFRISELCYFYTRVHARSLKRSNPRVTISPQDIVRFAQIGNIMGTLRTLSIYSIHIEHNLCTHSCCDSGD